jgi:hypothetical protein
MSELPPREQVPSLHDIARWIRAPAPIYHLPDESHLVHVRLGVDPATRIKLKNTAIEPENPDRDTRDVFDYGEEIANDLP